MIIRVKATKLIDKQYLSIEGIRFGGHSRVRSALRFALG